MKDGKILAVGSLRRYPDAYKGNATKVFDLAGKALLPGFLDAHCHYINSLTVANQVNVYPPPAGPGKDPASIVAGLTRFRDKQSYPAGTCDPGVRLRRHRHAGGILLTRDDLDEEFPDNPVLVGHVSMHGAVLNSAALKKWTSRPTRHPARRRHRAQAGHERADGLIMETAYVPIFSSLPKPTREQEIEWSRAGQMLYAQAGITTAQEGATHADDLEIMKRVRRPAPTSSTSSPFPSSPTWTRCLTLTPSATGASTTIT